MIVFSGPTASSLSADLSKLDSRPSSDDVPFFIHQGSVVDSTVKSISTTAAAELTAHKKVNLSDLASISVDVLCSLQQLYQNRTDGQWVWELTDVNISDVVRALGLDGYMALSDVIVVPLWFKWLMTVLFLVTMIWATAANTRMLVAIGTTRSAWSSTNILIGALAWSDLVTVCCTTPTEISAVIHDLEIWDFDAAGCVIFPFLQSAAILSNGLMLCMIAYDRYVCVVKMKPYSLNAKSKLTLFGLIALAWMISVGIAMPQFWQWRIYYYIVVDDIPDPEIGVDFCSVFPICGGNDEMPENFLPLYHFILCGAIFIPIFVVFLVLYCRIGHFLWVRSAVGVGRESTGTQMARKKKVVWALFWLIFWFFVCRMPNWIFVMATMFRTESFTKGLIMLKSVLVFLSVLNTVVNPWLYSRLNEPLKKTLKSCTDRSCEPLTFACLFLLCCKESQQEEPEQLTNNSQNSNHSSKISSNIHQRSPRRSRRTSSRKIEPYTIDTSVSLNRHSSTAAASKRPDMSRSNSRASRASNGFRE